MNYPSQNRSFHAVMPVAHRSAAWFSHVLELEAKMTQSAFGYEYAVMHWDEAPEGVREYYVTQIEFHRNNYISARQTLKKVAPEKIESLEKKIAHQKTLLLQGNRVIH